MHEFLKNEIRAIKRRTAINYHGENYEFIAKKLGSPLVKEFRKINEMHKKQGFLNMVQSDKRYHTYEKLMKELQKKNPKQYQEVRGSL
jgi:hypothetical protein